MQHLKYPTVRSRLSILAAAFVGVGVSRADVVINEIHYNGEPNTARNEFVELHNTGAAAIDLGGWVLDDAVSYVFPAGTTLAAGGYVVVAENPPSVAGSLGPYAGRLSGDTDQVVLRNADGLKVDEVNYKSEFPWPIGADGSGASMELIHPSLDNDLAGAWRSSLVPGRQTERMLVERSAAGWRWRAGESEASDPVGAWRETGFAEDGTWSDAALPIGFGGVTDMTFNTTIEGMQSNYTSVFLRRTFEVAPGEVPGRLEVRHAADDGIVVWINGHVVARRQVDEGEQAFDAVANSSGDEGEWQSDVHEDAASFVVEGANTLAIQLFNSSIGGSDLGVDLELVRLASRDDIPPAPTPGARNSVFSVAVPPMVRQVRHSPEQPSAGAAAVVSAKVTDPDGVAVVRLEYQVVQPGAYVPAYLAKTTSLLNRNPTDPNEPNPEYFDPARWTAVAMVDDGTAGDATAGDDVYSATLPGQVNRALVRYRLVVGDSGGASVRVPYADDPSLNFAYFVYDGVPAYVADTRSVLGVPHTYSAETMSGIPVYHLLTHESDFEQCVGYNSRDQISSGNYDARNAYNWRATFVYNGKVYDHIGYRLRQRNARYSGTGKRSFKFRFNDGNYIQLHDNAGRPYATKWRLLAAHKMLGSRGNFSWGMDQAASHHLWNLVGVPASKAHWFHFRVVKGAEERPQDADGQYTGDFYGIELAMEEFDKRFLDARGMKPGNIYKLITGRTNGKDVQRYQAPMSVDDASDFSNIINRLRPQRDDQWLRDHVNWDEWNWYHTVVDAVRSYDVSNGDTPNNGEHLKNRAYYFEPVEGLELGRLWLMPWDSDTSWGPNWNGGVDWPKNAIWNTNTGFTRPDFAREYLNTVREFRDLVWTEDQILPMLDRLAATIAPLVPADRDRWRSATATPGTGRETAPELEGIVEDMKEFAFNLNERRDSWVGGTWGGGAASRENQDTGISGREGRHKFLDWLADDPGIPQTPTITYAGTDGFPQDGLLFSSSAFVDPEGDGTFGSMEWRVAEIADEAGVPEMEFNAEWESGALTTFAGQAEVPAVAVKVGRTYRARVRHCDATGHWSHWSAPVEFKVSAPMIAGHLEGLVISEIMYHPLGPSDAEKAIDPGWSGDDFEWIELANVGAVALDLVDVRFTKGVEFDFIDGTRTSIAPGERIVVAGNIAAFNARYGFAETPAFVVGQFRRNLDNGGEQLKLSFGGGTAIRDLTYDDSAPWPAAADGDGFSLVLLAPGEVPDHALAASWLAGGVVGGTPGAGEPTGFTGDPAADADGDGVVALLEYAQGGSDSDGRRVAPVTVTVEDSTIRFLVPRNAAAGDVTFLFEVSADLQGWTAAEFSGWDSANMAVYAVPNAGQQQLWGRTSVTLR